MERLKGKTALVTGGALGIGRAACLRMAGEGARVAVTDTRDDQGHDVVNAIVASGGQAGFWHLDVSDETSVRGAVEDIVQAFGRLDILVNNAGISGANKPTHEVTEAEWDRLMAVNVKGVFFCTKHVVPYMLRAGSGSIINLSSIYGLVGAPDVPPYHASKGAVREMSKTDAMMYASHGIRVNSVHPGFIWTPMVENFSRAQGDVAAARAALDALHPLGHIGDADDIAWGIVYLASDEAKFITGAELVIDGGYTAR
ncbi:MAG TPA: glucose 1-dehydrogenase [Gemmatimonadales bacterium]|jgi:NAD(P)-dependent dehydrogenase (short-subunit alcohol dehydrogenase family)